MSQRPAHTNHAADAPAASARTGTGTATTTATDGIAPPPGGPTFSVIVPVYNSAEDLKTCLAALRASTFDDFEVVVVDDGSTQPIKPIVAEYGYRYHRIDGPGGPARARNRGVEHANGEIVVFVDADVCVHADTLARFSARFAADDTIDAVIGTYDDAPAHPSFLSQYKNLFHHYVHQDADGVVSTFWSGCGAMRKTVFRKFGGFDEKRYRRPAIEDIELGTWMTKAGHTIVLDQTVRCRHLKQWTLRGLIKTDVFDRGIPWTRLMLRAGTVPNSLNVKSTQRISAAVVYLTGLCALLGFVWPSLWIAAVGMALVMFWLNRDFYRYFAARRGWWFTLKVVPMHWLYFAYCGFCVGAGTLLHYLSREAPAPPMAGA